ncbi:MAG: aspartyl protease family protein [Parcubacteria group bacterium]
MTTRRSLLINLAVLGGGAAFIWYARDHIIWSAPQTKFALNGSSGWLPFARRGAVLPTLKATVNGHPVNALLDSGAQYSVIDRAFADDLKLPQSFAPLLAVGVGGDTQFGRGATVDVKAGGLTLSQLKAGVLDIGPLADRKKGLGAPLILGQDVLRQVVADIDFPNRRLLLAAPKAHPVPAGAKSVPVRAQGRALTTQLWINGHAVEAVIDTGASMVLALAENVAETAGLLKGKAKPRYGSSLVLGGEMAGQLVTAQQIAFGGNVLYDVEVLLFPAQHIPGFPRGLLGSGALKHFRAVFDQGQALHLLKPGRP